MPYAFNDAADDDWMSRYFFSGGMMPSDELPLHFQQHLQLQGRWRWNGQHYQRTANLWLANMDANRASLWPLLESAYGKAEAQRWWHRWRMSTTRVVRRARDRSHRPRCPMVTTKRQPIWGAR